MKRVNAYGQGHGRGVATLRFVIGLWLLGAAAYSCYRGVWFGALLIAPAMLHFYLGRRALQHGVPS